MTKSERDGGLRQMLTQLRQDLQDEVQNRLRQGRADRPKEARDDLEVSDADIQGDVAFALLHMKAETLARVDKALERLDEGKYGACFECEREISTKRLRALPFAVRCQACEGKREEEHGRARQRVQERGSVLPFPEAVR